MIIRLTIFLFILLSFKSNSQDGLVFINNEIPNLLTENINSIFLITEDLIG